MAAPSIAELRRLTDDELTLRHDEAAANTVVGVDYYLEELRRREADRQAGRMIAATDEMRRLTRWIALLTLVNLLLVALAYLRPSL